MAAPKRNETEIKRDRALITELYVKGWSFRKIAAHINSIREYSLSSQMIFYDMEQVRKEWRDRRDAAIDDHIAQELAKLDAVEYEAWEAWERSQKDAETIMKKTSYADENLSDDAKVFPLEIVHKRAGRIGDPRYLAIIKDCTVERRRLMGLDKPTKHDHTIHADPQGIIEAMEADIAKRIKRGDYPLLEL